MKNRKRLFSVKPLIAQALAIISAAPAYAYDSENAVPLTLSADLGEVSVVRIAVDLNGRDVTVVTELKNETTAHRYVAFYASAPLAGQLGEGEEHLDKSFSDIKVATNGAPSKVAQIGRSFFNGQDITDVLRRAGLGPFPDLNTDPKKLAKLPMLGGAKILDWQAMPVYAWSDRMAPGSSRAHKVQYRALPQFGLEEVRSAKFEERVYQHCGKPDEIRSLLGSLGVGSEQVLMERYQIPVSYMGMRDVQVGIAQPARNWLGARPVAVLACGLNRSSTQQTAILSRADSSLSLLVISAPASSPLTQQ